MLFQIDDNVKVIKELNVDQAPKGAITRYWLNLVTDGIGVPIHVPIIVARGKKVP